MVGNLRSKTFSSLTFLRYVLKMLAPHQILNEYDIDFIKLDTPRGINNEKCHCSIGHHYLIVLKGRSGQLI